MPAPAACTTQEAINSIGPQGAEGPGDGNPMFVDMMNNLGGNGIAMGV